jgi:hypothetical protein
VECGDILQGELELKLGTPGKVLSILVKCDISRHNIRQVYKDETQISSIQSCDGWNLTSRNVTLPGTGRLCLIDDGP